MSHGAPAEIRLGRQALTLLHRVLDAAAPEEGCALLLGTRSPAMQASPDAEAGVWRICHLWPCANAWEPADQRRRRFAVDPREQLHAIRWGRARGLEVLGSVHSHPFSEPRPSATDRALALPPALLLIRGAAPPEAAGAADPVLRSWWLEEGAQPQLLPWRMED